MSPHVAVVGGGPRAAEWATRFLAADLDVVVDDRAVADLVEQLWPDVERLGLFPGSRRDRLRVETPAIDAATTFVQVVGDARLAPTAPMGGVLVATDETAHAYSPIHLVPLVELADSPSADALEAFYTSIGMSPLRGAAPEGVRRALGPGLVELTGGEAGAVLAVMRALRPFDIGAGRALAEHEARRLVASGIDRWRPGDVPDAPLALYRATVEPEWVDYNGHMTEAAYLTAAGWASDALFRYIGDDEAYRAAGHSFYTVETHIHYVQEVSVHEPIRCTTQILGVDAKRVHLLHEMYHGDSDALLCTCEQMLVHVDMAAGRSVAILPDVADALHAIRAAHAGLPTPARVGSVMRLPEPRV
jgi:acyl-CoA thioesterase FadM